MPVEVKANGTAAHPERPLTHESGSLRTAYRSATPMATPDIVKAIACHPANTQASSDTAVRCVTEREEV